MNTFLVTFGELSSQLQNSYATLQLFFKTFELIVTRALQSYVCLPKIQDISKKI